MEPGLTANVAPASFTEFKSSLLKTVPAPVFKEGNFLDAISIAFRAQSVLKVISTTLRFPLSRASNKYSTLSISLIVKTGMTGDIERVDLI